MGNYPEKTCTNDRLVKQKKLVDATLAGVKTQQRRDGTRKLVVALVRVYQEYDAHHDVRQGRGRQRVRLRSTLGYT